MTVHIIGTGMAGLSAAFTLTQADIDVVLYDAAAMPGGRCHSFFDKKLNALIDAGTHLMLGTNTALLGMLAHCPTKTPLKPVGNDFLFYRKDGSSFKINTAHLFKALPYVHEFSSLLIESMMNTPAHQADKIMVVKTTLKCFGTKKGQLYLACPSLRDSIVDPVVDYLKNKNVPFHFGKRLRRVKEGKLVFLNNEEIILKEKDRIILAVDCENLSRLIVGAPEMAHQTIVNIHYKTDLTLPGNLGFIGLIGLTGHWLFVKNGVLSVTISAANKLCQKYTPEALVSLVWSEISNLFKVDPSLPTYRVIIERRATILQTARANRSRLHTDIGSKTVFLAADSLNTGLPCTIEGAVRSGQTAAQSVLKTLNKS